MKTGYKIAILTIIVLTIGVVILLLISQTETSWSERIVENSGAFIPSLAALLAAVIALSVADPKRRKAKIDIVQSLDKEQTYSKDEMSTDLKESYKDFPDPVKSHRVQFKMTNVSGIDLVKPTLTFRLPMEKQHPNKFPKEKTWSRLSFNSNIYNSTQELRIFEFADTSILTNSNLPYRNSEEEITIWIRMVLDDGKLEPFDVEVSVNCENVDGFTQKIIISPKDLLNAVDTTRNTSAGLNDQIQGEKEET